MGTMKIPGIIGGVGPASTLDYYTGIIDGCRSKFGGNDYPEVLISSINMNEVITYVRNKDWDALVDKLADTVSALADAGADFAVLSANTLHIVFDRVAERSRIPLISIVDETCRYARSRECRKVLVIGTYFTMSSGIYPAAFKRYGIDAVVPSDQEQQRIHSLFFPNLENGIVIPEDKQQMLELLSRLILEHNADALVLGCTELPLMIKEGDLDIPLIDTTKIHIASIVDSI